MELVLNTAYGFSILLYHEGKLLYQYQNLSTQSEDVFDKFRDVMDNVFPKYGLHVKQLKNIIFIDGPGSQIGSKVGVVCLKPILLLYPYIHYKMFSYFEVMLMNVFDKVSDKVVSDKVSDKVSNLLQNDVALGGFYKQSEILLAIGVSKQRFYCAHVVGQKKCEDGGKNMMNAEYKKFISINGEEVYFKIYSYSYIEINTLLEKNSNLLIIGHERFENNKNYIKGLFPLTLEQIQKVVRYLNGC